jgi:hypothetical protein
MGTIDRRTQPRVTNNARAARRPRRTTRPRATAPAAAAPTVTAPQAAARVIALPMMERPRRPRSHRQLRRVASVVVAVATLALAAFGSLALDPGASVSAPAATPQASAPAAVSVVGMLLAGG